MNKNIEVMNYPDLYAKYQSGSIQFPVMPINPVISTKYIIKDPSVVLGELMSENTEYSGGSVSITLGNATTSLSYQTIIDLNITDNIQNYWNFIAPKLLDEYEWLWAAEDKGEWAADLSLSPTISDDSHEITLLEQYVFYPIVQGFDSFFKDAVNAFSYAGILNMIVFNPSDDSLPVKVYSNGGDRLVLNQHINKLTPSQIMFIPAYSWDGSARNYSESELEVSGI
jgi:hypothetical protein